ADRNRSHWSTSKTPSYTKSVSWQHHHIRVKTYADGRQEEIYMIYLIFDCVSANRDICINDEFQDYAWVKPEELALYDLNVATRHTLALKGLL
ncbi:nucleoside triphosphatase NudI, partial [Salmonella sp. C3340]|uniref:nucleoside triphosphatase NudI n=1 Tax=unclassified Salmonella TaxID=2614656 RepID=UPI002A4516EF|nr:nucleoside triphosphatase NudI [Salmonella enterica]MCQ7084876.1 nucleoside triphosphatase NudI [Salmonella enterica]MCQ7228590.1 nucleoside triphosphatase NudI [Salmonella enterica]MCQ7266445.1 nucleoside triphosphatase NudI [Salmonella enterica]MCQ7301889.1 nucleoside triphosphatase NudI [Salmonella enterica]